MTTTTEVRNPSPDGPPPAGRLPLAGRDVRYLVAAMVVIVGVVAAVLVFGVHRPPRLDPVEPGVAPEPPAALAWSAWSGDADCLHVLEPDGQARQVACQRDGFELLAWDETGIVLLQWSGAAERLETIDPDTGAVLDSRTVRGADAVLEPELDVGDTALSSRWRDGVLSVTDEGPNGTVLWAVEAPEVYRVERGTVAPDGSVLAGVDSAGRLLVFDPTGERPPRLWHDDVPTWGRLVWQGTALPGTALSEPLAGAR